MTTIGNEVEDDTMALRERVGREEAAEAEDEREAMERGQPVTIVMEDEREGGNKIEWKSDGIEQGRETEELGRTER